MSHDHPTHFCARCCGFVFDTVRWVWDVLVLLSMSLLGALLLGHRPRACTPTEVNTSTGEFHGCGRACHYYNPRWFTPLCRECTIQTDDGTERALCRMGNDPQFALPVGVSLPLIGAIVLLLLGSVIALLYTIGVITFPWDLEKPKKLRRPPITLERLLVGNEKIEEERRNAAKHRKNLQQPDKPLPRTAAGTRMAKDAKYKPVPSALERFRRVKSGPTERLKTRRTSRVPRRILSTPTIAPRNRSTTLPAAKGGAKQPATGKTAD